MFFSHLLLHPQIKIPFFVSWPYLFQGIARKKVPDLCFNIFFQVAMFLKIKLYFLFSCMVFGWIKNVHNNYFKIFFHLEVFREIRF